MFDYVKSMSPATEKSCRLTALINSDLNNKQQNRRRRLNVRRLKQLYRTSSIHDDNISGLIPQTLSLENFNVDNGYYKKKKKTEEGVVLSATSKVPLDQVSSRDRVVVSGSSSSNEVNKVQHVTCLSHGSISLIGRRREMEDAVDVKLGLLSKGGKKYDFFGVYDGHGGSRVAHACKDSLHRIVMQVVMEESDGVINWEKVMKYSFVTMDEEVDNEGGEMATMGSTAVVAVVGEDEVIVANCGDSRAVISRGGVAVPLSIDHKPDRPDELDRIENSGGKVINWNGQRVLGVLATSRSIGDGYLKPYVIPDPEVIVSKRSDLDEFLILASDGLWDVIPNDIACEVTRRCLKGQMRRCSQQGDSSLAAQAASFLAELSIGRGSKDNISVIVVELNKSKYSTNDQPLLHFQAN